MKTVIKYIVTAEHGQGCMKTTYESEPMDSIEECRKWIDENLPVGVQKCRTGTYEILELPSLCDPQHH